MTKNRNSGVVDEGTLDPGDKLDAAGVLFFYSLSRQAQYEARKAGRLKTCGRAKTGGRSFLYRVRDLRKYRDSQDPRGKAHSSIPRRRP